MRKPNAVWLRAILVIMCALPVFFVAVRVHAADSERSGIQSYALRAAYGIGARDNIKFFSLLPRVSLFVPRGIDRTLLAYDLQAEFVVEPIVSYITNSTDTVEAGVNPLFFSLRYDRGQAFVPVVEGGEGVLYTDRGGHHLGERVHGGS